MAIESMRVSLILLAAGRSERFRGNKLLHPVAGRPLAHHAASTLSTISFAERIAVVGATDPDFAPFGFRSVQAPGNAPISASIRKGVAEARANGCEACLIALADMPFVPASHFIALLDAHIADVTASASNGVKSVPAIFSRAMFSALETLEGDRGARHLLATAASVDADPMWLSDIDTRADLDAFLLGP